MELKLLALTPSSRTPGDGSIGPQQGLDGGDDRMRGGHPTCDGDRSGDGLEAGEADLDRQRARRSGVGSQAGGDRIGKSYELANQLDMGVPVGCEGLLVADRLHLPVDLDGSIVDPPGQTKQVTPVGSAHAGDQGGLVELGEIRDGVHSDALQSLQRGRPHTPQRLNRKGVQEQQLSPGQHLDHAAALSDPVGCGDRLGGDRGQLGQELVGSDTDGTSQLQFVPHPLADRAGDDHARTVQTQTAGDVEKRLVECQRFDERGDRGEDAVHVGADRRVQRMITRQEDGLGAQPFGGDAGQRRPHPVATGLVRCRSNHSPGTGTPDDDGLADEIGTSSQLDADVERVHVDVEDDPLIAHSRRSTRERGAICADDAEAKRSSGTERAVEPVANGYVHPLRTGCEQAHRLETGHLADLLDDAVGIGNDDVADDVGRLPGLDPQPPVQLRRLDDDGVPKV